MAACGPSGESRRGNVLLVVVDTLRQDHLELYGYGRPTAPHLARLGRGGATLDGVSPTSWTKPAVASLLTGLHPIRHQALAVEDSLPAGAATLAEVLRARGWRTHLVTANGFSGPAYRLDRGFERSQYLGDLGAGPFADAERVNQVALGELARLQRPYFLMVHYLDPHAPYNGPDWTEGWYAGGSRAGTKVAIEDLEAEAAYPRPPEFLRRAVDAYDAEIRRTDEALSRLLEQLHRRGLLQDTLTVVVSDHGEEFQEHGRMGHGLTLYEEVVRVPLVFHWPGRIPPARSGPASLLDVAPTILGLLGLPGALPSADGRDLSLSLGAGRRVPPDPGQLLHLDAYGAHALALRAGGQKLLLARHPQARQLFDLRVDPGERQDLWPARPQAVADASRRMTDAYALLVPRALPREVASVQPTDALRALGYVAAPAPQPRGIPGRLRLPEWDSTGVMGWGSEARMRPCIDVGEVEAEEQLLEGWYSLPEAEGRASLPRATASFPPAAGTKLGITLSGSNPGDQPARLVARLAGQVVAERRIQPAGAFAFEVEAEAPAGGRLCLELERQPPLLETRHPRTGRWDRRPRGFIWRRLCVKPVAPPV